jgi:hypothetical protein
MKNLLVLGVALLTAIVLVACGDDNVLPALPGSIIEAPLVESVEENVTDQSFNWSDLFDIEDEEDYEEALVLDFGEESSDGDLTSFFADGVNTTALHLLEETPSEMVLEQGIPLEGTNQDLAGLAPTTLEPVMPIEESLYDDDDTDIELPPIEVQVEQIIEIKFEEAEELPQTSDTWTPIVLAGSMASVALFLLAITQKKSRFLRK